MKHCITCTCDDSHLLNAAELLEVLKRSDRRRDVYRGGGSDRWFVTHTDSGGETTFKAIQELLQSGVLRISPGHTHDYFCLNNDEDMQ